jgi:hypothetical protein
VTDPADVREQLRRLARGDPVAPWNRERVLERAERASEDVEDAAAFVDDGGLQRLAGAMEADERDGNADRAARERAVLGTFERFAAACDGGSERTGSDDPAEGPPPDETDDSATGSGSLPPRSRNH